MFILCVLKMSGFKINKSNLFIYFFFNPDLDLLKENASRPVITAWN